MELCSTMSCIKERMDSLEARQKSLENEVRANTSVSSSSTCTLEPNLKGRHRVTPTSLQVCCRNNYIYIYIYITLTFYFLLQSKIRRVHASIDEENQFIPSEP